MTPEQQTIEEIERVLMTAREDEPCDAIATRVLSVIREIVFEEVEKDIPDGVMPLSGCRCVRSRTAAEIKAALIERLGRGE